MSDEHHKLHVAMETGLRDLEKEFMGALDLTTLISPRGWSSEEGEVEVRRKLQAESAPIGCCFLHSTGAVWF